MCTEKGNETDEGSEAQILWGAADKSGKEELHGEPLYNCMKEGWGEVGFSLFSVTSDGLSDLGGLFQPWPFYNRLFQECEGHHWEA